MMFTNKNILITGGTGSFGHAIVKRLLDAEATRAPHEIRIFSRDEKKQYDMRREFAGHPNLTFIIGDVRDPDSVSSAMRDVEIVIHAAALKQVPNCEENVSEAIFTNTLGAINVIRVAMLRGVGRVIAISTDKAVKPINVMGMTKALQERLFINANRHSDVRFACVRYGNVLGSRGSVVPLFKEQIAAGGPVTLTHPNMTRFLITLPQAIGLVFSALHEMTGGEIFVRKSPNARMGDIASAMIENLVNGREIETRIVGIRPGEKMHETLISEEESWRTLERPDDFVILPAPDSAEQHMPSATTATSFVNATQFEYTSTTYPTMSREDIAALLKKEGWL